MDFRESLEKLRGLPDKQKKIVLWAIVGVLGAVMLYFWLGSAAKTISKFSEINVQMTDLNITK